MLSTSTTLKACWTFPCGDWFWMQYVHLTGVEYTGGEIVNRIIQQNQVFASENVSFQYLDLLEDQLPEHDLIFCRDCLVHFSCEDIRKALKNLVSSGSKYLLTTTFVSHKNYDIVTGNWRPLNLEVHPFELPKPLMVINEYCKNTQWPL